MASFRDFLLRFRPAGAPGRPAVTGAPVDRGAELRDELEPLLALLDAPGAEADEIRAAAARQAQEIRHAGRVEAEQVLAAAREAARTAHDQAQERAFRRAETEAERLLAAVERDTARVLRSGRERLPALTDEIVTTALALATAQAPAEEPPS